jgi:hypothetical protein
MRRERIVSRVLKNPLGLLLVVGTLGILAAILVPGVRYPVFLSQQMDCQNNLANMKKVSEVLHTALDGRATDGWIGGRQLTDEQVGCTAPCEDNVQRSRLAFWRMVADPKIRDRVSGIGTQVFLCPGSDAPKQAAVVGDNRDFPDPRRNLSYSMFCQVGDEPTTVPTYGTRGERVIMGDRSPLDDGLPLHGNSGNHTWADRPTGQNVCYATGRIKWVETPWQGVDEDHIYAVGSDPTVPITRRTTPLGGWDTILMPVDL